MTSMESIKVFKGYGKVNPHLNDQAGHQQRTTSSRPKVIILTILAILLLTLIIGVMLAALVHESNTEPPESPSLSSSSDSAESVKTVCGVTQYPTSCFNSISSLVTSKKPDPETIFNLSLQVSIKELKNLSSFVTSVNDVNSQAAINDCVNQFDDALSRLNDSLLAMEVGPGEKALTMEKVNNIQTWISAAMTDQETCLEGLEEMGSRVLDEVKAKMERSKEFLSNSLAIIAKMQVLLEKFDLKMH